MTEKKGFQAKIELHTYAGIQCVKKPSVNVHEGSSQHNNIRSNSAEFKLNVRAICDYLLTGVFPELSLCFQRHRRLMEEGALTDAGTPGDESNQLQNI